jgi:hypothetical protein
MLLIKTDSGQAAFKERSPRFSSRQRSMFILVDGKKTAAQILAAAAGLGVNQADLDYMIEQGFLSAIFTDADVSAPAPLSLTEPMPLESVSMLPPQAAGPVLSDQERYQLAKPLATQLTATLGLRGFMLNLSVESAAGYEALLALFPQIQKAVGAKAARELERALKE